MFEKKTPKNQTHDQKTFLFYIQLYYNIENMF